MSTIINIVDQSKLSAVEALNKLKEDITLDNIQALQKALENLFKARIRKGISGNSKDNVILGMKQTLREMTVALNNALKRGNSTKVEVIKSTASSTLELMLKALKTDFPPTHLPSKGGAKRKTRKHKKANRKTRRRV